MEGVPLRVDGRVGGFDVAAGSAKDIELPGGIQADLEEIVGKAGATGVGETSGAGDAARVAGHRVKRRPKRRLVDASLGAGLADSVQGLLDVEVARDGPLFEAGEARDP